MDKLLDINDFQQYSGVSETDKLLMVKGATGTDASITFSLFINIVEGKIKPEIVNGEWYIGGVATGVEAGSTPQLRYGSTGIEYRYKVTDEWATLITINTLQQPAVDIANELKEHPVTVSDNSTWLVWDVESKEYIDTGIYARGKSPVIKDSVWWIWSDTDNEYVSTGQAVNSDFVLTKEAVEGILTGNVLGHYHIQYTIPTLESEPLETTLSWNDNDGNLYNFYIGQLCRIADSTSDNGYKFYQLYDIKDGAAVWGEISGGGGVGKTYKSVYPNGEIFNDYANNIAFGQYAHAEGRETNATGPRAHAEGYKTTVYAADAHAEGRNTWAMGAQSHVEGMYGISWGALSHIEGYAYSKQETGRVNPITLSSPDDDNYFLRRFMLESNCFLGYDEEGGGTYYVVDIERLLEKYYMHASFGERNHVEGCNNICFTNGCHIEGDSNICGRHVTAHGAFKSNSVIHIEGSNNDVITKDYFHNVIATHVEGSYNTVTAEKANVSYSHIGGSQSSIVDCNYAFAHGFGISVSNDFETAFGRYNLSEQDGKKVLFAYGIGTSSSNRKNAFSVLEDGTVVIPKMAGGNTEDIVNAKLAPLQNRLTNIYNELTAIISKQQAQIDSLTSLITQLHPGLKVFVIGDRLVITSLMDADVDGGQLDISDADTKVVGDVLVFGEYVPEPPTGDAKAYVYVNTLYFTDLIDASVAGSTLSISDTETIVTNGILTIKQ